LGLRPARIDPAEVTAARAGETQARDRVLRAGQPLVRSVLSQVCHRFITESDDEWSVGLIALNEAIDAFDADKGDFEALAAMVIRRRLRDSYRRVKAISGREVPESALLVGDDEDDEGQFNPVADAAALTVYADQEASRARQMEIAALAEDLDKYGINFNDLVEGSPKHADARESAVFAARKVAEDDTLYFALTKTRSLPLKELTCLVKVSRKTLERNRKYIIALALILRGDYPYLYGYLKRM
jgi:RNA polymerase sigma factor